MMQRKILVADDTPAVIDFVRQVLEPAGYRVLVATDGAACVERAKKHQVDLVLMDIMMPVVDGYEACKRLKADPATAAVPVIFLSAMAGGFDKQKAFESGAADYVTKPVDPLELEVRVKAQLALREQEARLESDARLLERRVAERTAELKEALESQAELLRELSHRVMNNFQLMLAMINQQVAAGDSGDEGMLKLAGRVEALSLVYELLNESKRLDGIDMDVYLAKVAGAVAAGRPACRARLEIDVARAVFPIDRAMPCGLLVHELVASAADYGLRGREGSIRVRLSEEAGGYSLEVSDSASDVAAPEREARENGLWIRFVEAMASQIDAKLERGTSGGYALAIPREKR